MGILESIVGNLLGGNGGQGGNQGAGGSGLGGIVSSVLGGGQGGMCGMGGGGMGGGAMGGGLGGLMSQFQQAGLGHIAQSWIGNGANQPVSPDQLQSVFGQGQTQAMADQAGMDHGDFLQQLSQHLPQAVDGMTPNGQADDGSMNV